MNLDEELTTGAWSLGAMLWGTDWFRRILEDVLIATGPQGFVVATLVLDGRRGNEPGRLTATLSSHGGPQGSLTSRPVMIPKWEQGDAC